jgi:hypothetical protein
MLHPVIEKWVTYCLVGKRDSFHILEENYLLSLFYLHCQPTSSQYTEFPNRALQRLTDFEEAFSGGVEDPDKVNGGHCLVNWRTYTRPRNLGGGVGIKYLEKFSQALRLKCLWHHWDLKERP